MFISFIFLLAGVGGPTWAGVVVPVFYVTMGYVWHSPGLVTYATSFTTNTVFEYGLLVIILGALITAFGPKVYSRIMYRLSGDHPSWHFHFHRCSGDHLSYDFRQCVQHFHYYEWAERDIQ